MDCLFCNIANGTIASQTVEEDAQVRVVEDIHPKAPIHLLVMPKIHIPSIAHLEENHQIIISHMIFTAKRVAERQGLKGYKLVFNVGREGGQVIDHLHLHLLGGWLNPPSADRPNMP
jgi:histidine triad (HIT) family protein